MFLESKAFFGSLSVALGLANMGFYIFTIFRGQTRPHLFTWLIWTFTNAVIFFAQLTDAAGPGAWLTGVAAIVCAGITVLSVFRGEKNITRHDWLVLLVSLAALPLWYFMHNPLASVLLLTLIDAFGFLPTFRKSFTAPHSESAGWTLSAAFSCVLAVLALEKLSWITLTYPAAMVFLHAGLGVYILWRRRALA